MVFTDLLDTVKYYKFVYLLIFLLDIQLTNLVEKKYLLLYVYLLALMNNRIITISESVTLLKSQC